MEEKMHRLKKIEEAKKKAEKKAKELELAEKKARAEAEK